MATETMKTYRNQVLYSVFVRNFTQEGTFHALQLDLDRIQSLGVDIIWLLPIHPIGVSKRKGKLGSPYAVMDYRSVNQEYGTLDDFKNLVDDIHSRNMKCIIDIVFNHTSPDSVLMKEHAEWFYRKKDGKFGNKIGEWLDVIDLDYDCRKLWDYQIETLKIWAEIVDGFRCDVAPLIPKEFWQYARNEVEAVKPGCFWLAESVEPVFTRINRGRGITSLSDSELFEVFDCCYDYDVYDYFLGYLEGRNSLERYAEEICRQEATYSDNYVKLRFLENHDNSRAKFLIPDDNCLINWTAFCYFQKGMTLLYAGQEQGERHLPSLFEKDSIDWKKGETDMSFFNTLYNIKKNPIMTNSVYEVSAIHNDVLYATHTLNDRRLTGVFDVKGSSGIIIVDLPDGKYRNLIDQKIVEVQRGKICSQGLPIIIESQIMKGDS